MLIQVYFTGKVDYTDVTPVTLNLHATATAALRMKD